MTHFASRTLVLATLVGLCGCMDTNQDVIDQHRAAYEGLRARLKELAALLPPAGRVRADQPAGTMDPPLILRPGFEATNTEVLMYEQLLDPNAKPELDVDKDGWMLWGLRLTGPKSPLSDMEQDYFAKDEFKKRLSAGHKYRYLVVYRTVTFDKPTYTKFVKPLESSITPGLRDTRPNEAHAGAGAILECFVIDIDQRKILASQRLIAQAPKQIALAHERFSFENREAFDEYAAKLLMIEIDTQLAPRLRDIVHGTVELRPAGSVEEPLPY